MSGCLFQSMDICWGGWQTPAQAPFCVLNTDRANPVLRRVTLLSEPLLQFLGKKHRIIWCDQQFGYGQYVETLSQDDFRIRAGTTIDWFRIVSETQFPSSSGVMFSFSPRYTILESSRKVTPPWQVEHDENPTRLSWYLTIDSFRTVLEKQFPSTFPLISASSQKHYTL